MKNALFLIKDNKYKKINNNILLLIVTVSSVGLFVKGIKDLENEPFYILLFFVLWSLIIL